MIAYYFFDRGEGFLLRKLWFVTMMICKPHKNESKLTKKGLVLANVWQSLLLQEKWISESFLWPVTWYLFDFFLGVAKHWKMDGGECFSWWPVYCLFSVGTWMGWTANIKTNICDKGSSSSSSASSSSVHHFSCLIHGEEHAKHKCSVSLRECNIVFFFQNVTLILLMDKILHHQGWWLSHYL